MLIIFLQGSFVKRKFILKNNFYYRWLWVGTGYHEYPTAMLKGVMLNDSIFLFGMGRVRHS
jgi:hypothetical protein